MQERFGTNYRVFLCGLVINPKLPFLGTSPDAKVIDPISAASLSYTRNRLVQFLISPSSVQVVAISMLSRAHAYYGALYNFAVCAR